MQETLTENFDRAAADYDTAFTFSSIGVAQRERVWFHLNKVLNNGSSMNILELNCGTGEDAIRLARKGHNVLATDVSLEMLRVAKSKSSETTLNFAQLDISQIGEFRSDNKFDLIFSKFGGINCVDHYAVKSLGNHVQSLLSPAGKFIAVVMPEKCIWEIMYFLAKLKTKNAFRRSSVAIADVSGSKVKTWYYSPKRMAKLIESGNLKTKKLKPIGLFIPPSYLQSLFNRNQFLLKIFVKLEALFANLGWQAVFSDHYYIEFEKE